MTNHRPHRRRHLAILAITGLAMLGVFVLVRFLIPDSKRSPVPAPPPADSGGDRPAALDLQPVVSAQEAPASAVRAQNEAEELPPRPPLNPAITLIEDQFLINGKKFSELPILEMSLEEVDDVARAIQRMQQKEQAACFSHWNLDDLPITSGRDYVEQRLFLSTDLMAFPIKRDGKVTGDWYLASRNDCPAVYGMREMLRAVWKNKEYAERNKSARDDCFNKVLKDHPFAHLEGPEDMSKFRIFDSDGTLVGGGGQSTVGND